MYVALFTCALTRAIHLELVKDCSVDEFLCALRRFVSRKAVPDVIICDNATTFERADKTLQCVYSDQKVERFATPRVVSGNLL